MEKNIVIKGAKENNLKGVDLTIPRDKMIVFTGLSGSGNLLLHSTRYMRRDRRSTWSHFPRMRDSFSAS